jgi:hypothetical protein
MRKIIFFSVVIVALLFAYASKPSDKTCIIKGVKAVWGDITPDPYKTPGFFEEFMNLNSRSVNVRDWIFFKQVVYTMGNERKTVGIGAFKNVFVTVRPIQITDGLNKKPAVTGYSIN